MRRSSTAALLVVAAGMILTWACGGPSGGNQSGEDGGGAGADVGNEGMTEMGSPEGGAGDAHLSDGGGGGGSEAPSEAPDACTPLTGGDFYCGTVMCNGVTSYCFHGYMGQMCAPMPPECQCAETHGCDCLLANVHTCDAGPLTCSTVLFDGGLVFLQGLNCP
jgi:hypothetical protein